ncbi:MAG: chromate transporter [Xanthobacteraceae bacterium]|nr:chromate transporter [Xanthobacteraceae bacterium]
MTENALAPSAVVVPTVPDLFFGFAKIAISGFGGVLPWARRIIVQQRRWMSADEFNDLFAICQFLPGPNIVNFSLIYGSRVGGVPGATAAVLGLVGPPTVLMIVLGTLYSRYGALPQARGALTGLAAAAAGLLIATAVSMAETLPRRGLGAILIAAAALVGVGPLQWPLLAVLIVLVPISIARAWRMA